MLNIWLRFQLASDAANVVAMTDDEKKRLEDLLNDLDTLPEAPDEEDLSQNVSWEMHEPLP